MVIDEEAFQRIMAAVKPTASVGPIPTAIPNPVEEEVQAATEVGRRALW